MKHNAKVLVLGGILLLGGLAGFPVFFFSSHAVPMDRFDKIAVGMTEAEVKDLIGVPYGVRHDGADSRAFCYGSLRRLKWCTMEVYFGRDDRVKSKFHDH